MTKPITFASLILLTNLLWLTAGLSAANAAENAEIPRGYKPGFIITLDQDTIHGFIERTTSRNDHFHCRFKRSAHDEAQTFGPRQLKGYGFDEHFIFNSKAIELETFLKHVNFDINQLEDDDEIIHLLEHFDFVFTASEANVEPVLRTADGQPVNLQPLFLKVIMLGDVSMFTFGNMFFAQQGQDGELFLLRQIHNEVIRNNTTYRITTNEYLGVLNLLTRDCPQVNSQVMGTRFTFNAIRDLLISYNECVGSMEFLPNLQPPLIRINPGLSFYTGISSLSVKTNPDLVPDGGRMSETTTTVYPAIYLDIIFPRTHNRVNLSLGAQIRTLEFDDYRITESRAPGTIRHEQYFLNQTYLTVPFELHYRPFNDRFHTSLVAGTSLNFSLNEDYTRKSTGFVEETGEQNFSVTSTFHLGKSFNPGLFTGVDVRRSIGRHFYIAAGVRYEITPSLFNIWTYRKGSTHITENSFKQSFTFQVSILKKFDDLFR